MDLTNYKKTDFKKDNRDRSNQITNIVYGKVPPQASELEDFILGGIMLERGAMDRVAEILKPGMFYKDTSQRIYTAMLSLYSRNQPINIGIITEELRRNEDLERVGGPYAITILTNSVVSSANIEAHCKIVLQKFIQRELIRVSSELLQSAYEDAADPFELMSEAEQSLAEVNTAFQFGDMVGIESVIVSAFTEIQKNRANKSHVTGVLSGFESLDKATRGWQNGDLVILAARPSIGKTAFALSLIRNAAESFMKKHNSDPAFKQNVAVFSLEMKAVMLVLRMLASESKVLLQKIQTGHLDDEQMQHIFEKGATPLSRMRIKFDDKPGLTIQKLKSKCRKLKRSGELGLVVIDYLQLMTPSSNNKIREQQISEMSRELKLLAQELDVPIIALSQMSRDIEKRTGAHKKPMLSDLRESGAIEQDADVVMFLYGPDDIEISQDASLRNRRYVKIAKQRNGFLLTMDLDFKNEIQFFEEVEKMMTPQLPIGNWKTVASLPNYVDTDQDEDAPF